MDTDDKINDLMDKFFRTDNEDFLNEARRLADEEDRPLASTIPFTSRYTLGLR